MRRKLIALLLLSFIVFPTLSTVVGVEFLTVFTNALSYEAGEKVEVYGSSQLYANLTVLVVYNATGETVFNVTIQADDEGEYYAEFILAVEAPQGMYNVSVILEEAVAEAVFDVEASNQESLMGNLLSHVERSRIKVEEAFSILEAEGVEVPEEAEGSYENGVNAFQEAMQLEEEERYDDASTKAIQALNYFKTALHLTLKVQSRSLIEGQTTIQATSEDEGEKAVGLRRAIERARIFLYKVNQTAKRLEEQGFDATEIWMRLKEANQTLELALEFLDQGYINETARLYSEARGIIGQTNGLLHKLANQVKAWKAQQFLQYMEHRLQSLERNINQVQHRLTQGKNVLNALQAKKQIISRIRQRLTAGQLEDVMEDLDEMVEKIETTLDSLNGEGTAAQLKAMTRLEATIQSLNNTAQWLIRKGANITGIEQELQQTQALLAEITSKLQEGDNQAIQQLLEQARQQLQQTTEHTKLTQQKTITQQAKTWLERVHKWYREKAHENEGGT